MPMTVNGSAIQSQLLPERGLVAAQSVLPKLMADDDHSCGAALLLFNLKIAASERFDLEERQEVGGHAHAPANVRPALH